MTEPCRNRWCKWYDWTLILLRFVLDDKPTYRAEFTARATFAEGRSAEAALDALERKLEEEGR